MKSVIVVGAGTAGCVVAARLSEDAGNSVLLLEAGPDRSLGNRPAGIETVNWIKALGVTEAFWPDVMASRQPGDDFVQYMRGRGVGGSGAVNAMICLPGLPQDYDRWAGEFGCSGWSWAEVEPWFSALRSAVAPTEHRTPVDDALITAGSELGLDTFIDTYTSANGVGALYLSADSTTRKSTAELWLDPARERGCVDVLADSRVDRLLWAGDVCVGVRLMDGTELPADEVVLCAGAFESPAILLRSGVSLPGIGNNLRDHPAASIGFTLRSDSRNFDSLHSCINVVLRCSSSQSYGDIHLLPLHGTLDNGVTHGVVMAALMSVRSRGTVRLDPVHPTGPPIIDMQMLTEESDRQAMREAVQIQVKTLRSQPFTEIIETFVLPNGMGGLDILESDKGVDEWLRTTLGDYFHACGTCRMGQVDDDAAVVDLNGKLIGREGVHVMDASVMPDVPAANTHWPTVMIAERMAAHFMERSLKDCSFPTI